MMLAGRTAPAERWGSTVRALARAIVAAVAAAGLWTTFTAAGAEPRTVAVTAIVDHPALDAVREGILQGLASLGYTPGDDVVVTYESARGNPATAARIAERFVADAPDVIVALSTPSAQAVAAATDTIPVIFSAVTDPVAAGLVASADVPGGNVTGVSDMVPIADHVALIREITPSARTIGVLYNPAEANSVSSFAMLSREAEAEGLTLLVSLVDRSTDVEAAARLIVGRVDAIYVPTDNTVVSAFEQVAAVAIEAKLPLYGADPNTVPRGALAAVGFNYVNVGVETAALIHRVLSGEPPSEIAVVFAAGTDLHVNKATAEAIGVALPLAVLDRAARIVE